jgi:hypothetical protein
MTLIADTAGIYENFQFLPATTRGGDEQTENLCTAFRGRPGRSDAEIVRDLIRRKKASLGV